MMAVFTTCLSWHCSRQPLHCGDVHGFGACLPHFKGAYPCALGCEAAADYTRKDVCAEGTPAVAMEVSEPILTYMPPVQGKGKSKKVCHNELVCAILPY
jgi:hypothetical protein